MSGGACPPSQIWGGVWGGFAPPAKFGGVWGGFAPPAKFGGGWGGFAPPVSFNFRFRLVYGSLVVWAVVWFSKQDDPLHRALVSLALVVALFIMALPSISQRILRREKSFCQNFCEVF